MYDNLTISWFPKVRRSQTELFFWTLKASLPMTSDRSLANHGSLFRTTSHDWLGVDDNFPQNPIILSPTFPPRPRWLRLLYEHEVEAVAAYQPIRKTKRVVIQSSWARREDDRNLWKAVQEKQEQLVKKWNLDGLEINRVGGGGDSSRWTHITTAALWLSEKH